MKTLHTLLVLVLVMSFTACTSLNVQTDYNENTDFNTYHSFAFLSPPAERPLPLLPHST